MREDREVALSRGLISEDWNLPKEAVGLLVPLGYCRQREKGPLKTTPSKSKTLPGSCSQTEGLGLLNAQVRFRGDALMRVDENEMFPEYTPPPPYT